MSNSSLKSLPKQKHAVQLFPGRVIEVAPAGAADPNSPWQSAHGKDKVTKSQQGRRVPGGKPIWVISGGLAAMAEAETVETEDPFQDAPEN